MNNWSVVFFEYSCFWMMVIKEWWFDWLIGGDVGYVGGYGKNLYVLLMCFFNDKVDIVFIVFDVIFGDVNVYDIGVEAFYFIQIVVYIFRYKCEIVCVEVVGVQKLVIIF